MKDLDDIEKEDTIWVGHLYIAFDENDELPPPFIYIPSFQLMHTLVLSAASNF